jgi:hypothetical protein
MNSSLNFSNTTIENSNNIPIEFALSIILVSVICCFVIPFGCMTLNPDCKFKHCLWCKTYMDYIVCIITSPLLLYTYCHQCMKPDSNPTRIITLPHIVVPELFEIVIVTQPTERCEECVICYQIYGRATVAILSCGHKFHKNCLQKWLELSPNKDCPLCRGI